MKHIFVCDKVKQRSSCDVGARPNRFDVTHFSLKKYERPDFDHLSAQILYTCIAKVTFHKIHFHSFAPLSLEIQEGQAHQLYLVLVCDSSSLSTQQRQPVEALGLIPETNCVIHFFGLASHKTGNSVDTQKRSTTGSDS